MLTSWSFKGLQQRGQRKKKLSSFWICDWANCWIQPIQNMWSHLNIINLVGSSCKIPSLNVIGIGFPHAEQKNGDPYGIISSV